MMIQSARMQQMGEFRLKVKAHNFEKCCKLLAAGARQRARRHVRDRRHHLDAQVRVHEAVSARLASFTFLLQSEKLHLINIKTN